MTIRISTGAYIFLAVLLLLLPIHWVGAVLLAAAVHELFHLGAVLALGGAVRKITISGRGARMEADMPTAVCEMLSTLAGPIGSLLLLLFIRQIPRTAICGLIQGLFNLLPLFPLDGGRLLKSLLYAITAPHKAGRIHRTLQCVLRIGFFAFGAVVAIKYGAFVWIPLFFLLPRILFRGTIGVLSQKRYGYDRITKTNPPDGAEARTLHRRRV